MDSKLSFYKQRAAGVEKKKDAALAELDRSKQEWKEIQSEIMYVWIFGLFSVIWSVTFYMFFNFYFYVKHIYLENWKKKWIEWQ